MIREYQPGDHHAIAVIFTRAVHEIARAHYTPAQCLAWSAPVPNPAHWERRCGRKRPLVALREGRLAGFLELDPDGHIDCAYVNPDFQRTGVMTRLLRHAVRACLSAGLPRVHAEASLCARPLFSREGFRELGEFMADLSGTPLLNFRMELLLPAPSSPPPPA